MFRATPPREPRSVAEPPRDDKRIVINSLLVRSWLINFILFGFGLLVGAFVRWMLKQ